MATESTEEHGKISIKEFIFPCSSVDSVAKISILVWLEQGVNEQCGGRLPFAGLHVGLRCAASRKINFRPGTMRI